MSYARAHAEELGIDENIFENTEIHIHLPAGAIPKDGPSAGITLTTAIISLLTDTPVRMDVAMTGEVTLTGRVLPIGGVREKSLAALNQGISTIILPLANKKDLADIPDQFKEKLKFIFVENVDEVLAMAFDKKAERKSSLGPKLSKKNKLPRAAAA
jgi:ATP-dependent Lon protease